MVINTLVFQVKIDDKPVRAFDSLYNFYLFFLLEKQRKQIR